MGKHNVQSTSNEVTKGSSSTSSHLREEAIKVATVEADMDELRYNVEMSRNISGKVGEIQRVDENTGLGIVESQAREAAKSSSNQGQSEYNRQESVIGELLS